MKLLKQVLAVLGGLVVIALVVALVAPQSTRAVVATMVNVVNDKTNPVPNRDVDNPAREPFVLTEVINLTNGSISAFAGTDNLPTGRKYVILSVSVSAYVTKGADPNWVGGVGVTSAGQGAQVLFSVPNVAPGFNGGTQDIFAVTQPVYLAPDAGTNLTVAVDRVGGTGAGSILFTLTGYSVAE